MAGRSTRRIEVVIEVAGFVFAESIYSVERERGPGAQQVDDACTDLGIKDGRGL